MKNIAILGSTGSIGTNALDVIAANLESMNVIGLTAHSSWEQLCEQCERFQPALAVLTDDQLLEKRSEIEKSFQDRCPQTELHIGSPAVTDLAQHADVDVVLVAIVGFAGLKGTWVAVEAGKRVALANKETLVVAGPLIVKQIQLSGSELIPVDSEHSAIFQALQAGQRSEVRRIVLTASGGPFRGYTKSQLEQVNKAQALNHPTWDMGPKITIDSATMMNKALEVIEAKWLFNLSVEQIEVVVHPQSIIHSFVEFVDGSVIAHLSPPDMRLPIQYAITYPKRLAGHYPTYDWTKLYQLELSPPDLEAFPALQLGFDVARRGGSCGAVLNAANEIAVDRFLVGTIQFHQIAQACQAVLQNHHFEPQPTLDELLDLDAWAREETRRWRF